jgi:hypothetical protein
MSVIPWFPFSWNNIILDFSFSSSLNYVTTTCKFTELPYFLWFFRKFDYVFFARLLIWVFIVCFCGMVGFDLWCGLACQKMHVSFKWAHYGHTFYFASLVSYNIFVLCISFVNLQFPGGIEYGICVLIYSSLKFIVCIVEFFK